jgi:hypothetical protein
MSHKIFYPAKFISYSAFDFTLTSLIFNNSRDLVPLVLKNLFASGGGQPSLLPEIAENFPLSIDQLEYLQKLKESDPSLIIPPLIFTVFFILLHMFSSLGV